MVNETRTHIEGPDNDLHSAPRNVVKQEFAKRLYRRMVNRGWSQSDLARHANQKRNNISTYVRGLALPTPQNLTLLAKALGCKETDLLPDYVESAIDRDTPAFEMKVSPSNTSVAWLRLNRLVSVSAATAILKILEDDNADDGSRGGRAA